MTATPTRRLASLLGAALVAVLLPVALPVAPASAEPGCLSEVPVILPPSACDDSTPPETALGAVTPQPNAQGWVKTDQVSVSFSVAPTDGDTDQMDTECKLEGPGQSGAWAACTSPQTYTDLDDTDGTAYTFSVRAYDSADRAIDYDDPTTPLVNEDEVADEDATPETTTWKVDTTPPVVILKGGPYDSEGTGWPISFKRSVTYLHTASESPVDLSCQLDGSNVGCNGDSTTLNGLSGGHHVFSVSATDPAGNSDTTPELGQFTLPFNLTSGTGWTKRSGKGYFARDYLQARQRGAKVKFRARNVNEVRLLAPRGPDLGKVRIRIGDGIWHTIDLSGKATKRRQYVVVGPSSPTFSGAIQIESASRKLVRIDALVFPNT